MTIETLTIGLFFDGTGNNAFNTDLGRSHPSATDSVSYGNDHSNIYRLYQRYQKGQSRINPTLWQTAIYIEGIGTAKGQPDRTIPDMAFGTGEQGVIAKVQQSLQQIRQTLAAALGKDNFGDIKAIKFDIFGFSRGAAAARHLANLLHQDACNSQANASAYLNLPDSAHLVYSIRFMGLFDTVAAIALPVNGMSSRCQQNGELMLNLPINIASRVFHLVAEHECRYNFPLSSVKPYYTDFYLPGTHSDIGGGYQDNELEDKLLSQPAYNTVSDSSEPEQTRIYQQTVQEKSLLESHTLWGPVFRQAEMSIYHWQRPAPENKRVGMMKQVATAVRLRRQVRNSWAYVSLSIMLDAAAEAGCEIDPHNINNKIPASLTAIVEKLGVNSRALRKGTTEASTLSPQECDIISRDFIHCSAHWNEVIKTSMADEPEQLAWPVAPLKHINFLHRPDDHWQRETLIY